MKRTLLLTIIAFLVLTPLANAQVVPVLIDEYPIEFTTGVLTLRTEHPAGIPAELSAMGQSFTATGNDYLTQVDFYLRSTGAPSTNATATLFAHAGVFGTTGIPVGNALALSNQYDVTQLTINVTLISFYFNYDQQYQMTLGTNYFIVYQNPNIAGGGIDAANFVSIARDAAGAHAGNAAWYGIGAWVAAANQDTIFSVYGAPQPYVAQDTLQFETDTYRWVNATVRDGLGIANFATVDLTVNTTGDAESFTLRWTQIGDVFSETADTNFTAVIDAARSRRTIIDANTSILHYRFKMDNATTGWCDVLINGTDDVAAFQEFLQLKEFNYAGVSWTAVGDALDSAFSFWGIPDFMDQASDYINGLSGYFVSSITNLVDMMEQQMRLILAFFGSYLKVFTGVVDAMLNLWNIAYGIVNGTSGFIDLGIGNFWDWIAFATWQSAFYILLIVFWIDGLDNRAKATGRNTVNVIIADVNQGINLTSYFLSTFAFLLNEVANWALKLFDAITGVIPV